MKSWSIIRLAGSNSQKEGHLDWLLDALKAVAEQSRLRLLALCARGELTVGELTRILGQSQPRVSRHLKLLCDAGLLERFRENHFVFYRMASGERAAAFCNRILRSLPPSDAVLDLDRVRMEEIFETRRRAASRTLHLLEPELDRLRAQHAEESQISQAILNCLAGHEIGDLLDIGTGAGRMLKLLGALARRAVGIDISTEMLTVARDQLHQAGLGHISVRKGDMYHLNLPGNAFDTVTIDQVLGQAEAPETVIGECRRLLRPGGRLLIVDFHKNGAQRKDGKAKRTGIKAGLPQQWLEDQGFTFLTTRVVRGPSLDMVLILGQKTRRREAA